MGILWCDGLKCCLFSLQKRSARSPEMLRCFDTLHSMMYCQLQNQMILGRCWGKQLQWRKHHWGQENKGGLQIQQNTTLFKTLFKDGLIVANDRQTIKHASNANIQSWLWVVTLTLSYVREEAMQNSKNRQNSHWPIPASLSSRRTYISSKYFLLSYHVLCYLPSLLFDNIFSPSVSSECQDYPSDESSICALKLQYSACRTIRT